MKKCTVCKTKKNRSEFHKNRNFKDGHAYMCKTCRSDYDVEHSIDRKRKHLSKTYNITLETYEGMIRDQNGRCAICKRDQKEFAKPLAVDHNHITGEIRGLLCYPCNAAIGYLMADSGSKLLKNAIVYVENKHGK